MTSKPEFHRTVFHSPLGPVILLRNERAIIAVGFNDSDEAFFRRHQKIAPGEWLKVGNDEDPLLSEAVTALRRFFEHAEPFPSDLPLDPQGTAFQQRVWQELLKIPHGKITTYGAIAEILDSPGSARAVGAACGANPIPLFIPCHRVVGSNGNLCGFGGGGIGVKKQLIELESGQLQSDFQ